MLAILLTHEMGHFLQTVKYGIPASYPLCIPVPFNPIGTMGAVIGMDGMRADRRQIFDIGIAGPLAGLVVAFPVLWLGHQAARPQPADRSRARSSSTCRWSASGCSSGRTPTPRGPSERWVSLSELNPFFMAGWVGMLITGLNMLPISQLDGGHTMYALFLDRAHSFARFFISFAILYVVINLDEAVLWTPMLLLVIFLGIHHPPTANDNIELGPVRRAIGLASLAIPVLCFPLLGRAAVGGAVSVGLRRQQQPPRVRQVALHVVEEPRRRGAVDDAVVVGERQRHHQPRLPLVVDPLRQRAAAADEQDRRLRAG